MKGLQILLNFRAIDNAMKWKLSNARKIEPTCRVH
jgi:hypothetical protein